jgi:hypothetical protein
MADELDSATAGLLANPNDQAAVARAADKFATFEKPRQAALALIRRYPDYIGPRLLFAELCEREGESGRKRAEFIRNAVFLDRCPVAYICSPELVQFSDGSYRVNASPEMAKNLQIGRGYILGHQVPETIDRHTFQVNAIPVEYVGQRLGLASFMPSPEAELTRIAERVNRDIADRLKWVNQWADESGMTLSHQVTRFGFLEAFSCEWETWWTRAAVLLGAHPIRRVRLLSIDEEQFNSLLAVHHADVEHMLTRPGKVDVRALVPAVLSAHWPGVMFELAGA